MENVNKSEISQEEESNIVSTQVLQTKQCPIQSVTAYNDRAEITRVINANITSKGNHEIKLEGLSPLVDKNSVRISGGKGNATILEVSVQSRWTTAEDSKSQLEVLEKEKKELEKKATRIRESLSRVEKEAKWIEGWATRAIANGPSHDKATPPDFFSDGALQSAGNFVAFYGDKLVKFDERKVTLNEELDKLVEKIKKLEEEISQLSGPRSTERREVTVVLHTTEQADITLQLSYIITGASWHASYDCRVTSADNNIQIVYYGSITNSTGEDWNNIRLNLSTAKPSAGGSPPTLQTAHVQFKVLQPHWSSNDFSRQDVVAVQSMSFARPAAAMAPPMAPGSRAVAVLTTTAQQGASSTTFSIPRSATVAADSKPRKVTITIISELKPRFSYTTVPSKSQNVYLKVSATNSTNNYPLLPGPISIFMDNNYVATSDLKMVNPQEEFALFLGADSSIQVDYRPVKKFTEAGGWMSKVQTQHVECLTIIKNTKTVEAAVCIIDQLPLSSDDKIKVKVNEPNLKEPKGDIKLNEKNNIEWRYTIPPGGKIEVPLEYDIEFPKDKEIEVAE